MQKQLVSVKEWDFKSYSLAFAIFLIISYISCSDLVSYKSVHEDLQSVRIADSLVLYLDSETPNRFTSSQIIQVGNEFSIVNTFFQFGFLKFYSIKTGKVKNTLKIVGDTPGTIGDLSGSYFFDSTIAIIKGAGNNLYLFNILDTVKIKRIIFSDKGVAEFVPKIDNNLHIASKIDENKILVSNFHQYRKGRYAFNIIDPDENSYEQAFRLPDDFIEGFFGTTDFREWNYCYNAKKSQYIINFPNIDSLYILNYNLEYLGKVNGTMNNVYGNSKRVFDEDYYSDVSRNITKSFILSKTKTTVNYTALFYNEKNDVYYRIIGHPLDLGEIDLDLPIDKHFRRYSIVVLDEKFNALNEYKLPQAKYLIENSCFFLWDGHLYLQKRDNIEDKVTFHKLNLLGL